MPFPIFSREKFHKSCIKSANYSVTLLFISQPLVLLIYVYISLKRLQGLKVLVFVFRSILFLLFYFVTVAHRCDDGVLNSHIEINSAIFAQFFFFVKYQQ